MTTEVSEKYRVIRELGRGGMGEVFLAEHTNLGTQCVIKMMHPNLAQKKNLVDRMRLEAQALARLNHPNIVRVTDFDKTSEGRPFFVMEYMPGKSLQEEVEERGGYLPVVGAIAIVRQALAGLDAAHNAGLVHRDIKLDNLFVCDGAGDYAARLVKVLDFGVAKVVTDTGESPAPLAIPTGTGVVVGTPRFFAPEQARGKGIDHRVDIYAIGLVLYSLLAGRGPFDEHKNITDMAKAHVYQKPVPPSTHATQAVPAELDRVVLKCIEKNPDMRYQSAAELALTLEQVAMAAMRPPQPHAAPPLPSAPDVAISTTGSDPSSAKSAPKGDTASHPSWPQVKTAYLPEGYMPPGQPQYTPEPATTPRVPAPQAHAHAAANHQHGAAAMPHHAAPQATPLPHAAPQATPLPHAAPQATPQAATPHPSARQAAAPPSPAHLSPAPQHAAPPAAAPPRTAAGYSVTFVLTILLVALAIGGAVAFAALKLLP